MFLCGYCAINDPENNPPAKEQENLTYVILGTFPTKNLICDHNPSNGVVDLNQSLI